jgi:hypothetical protein
MSDSRASGLPPPEPVAAAEPAGGPAAFPEAPASLPEEPAGWRTVGSSGAGACEQAASATPATPTAPAVSTLRRLITIVENSTSYVPSWPALNHVDRHRSVQHSDAAG